MTLCTARRSRPERSRYWVSVVGLVFAATVSASRVPARADQTDQDRQFVRVERDARKRPVALETAIVQFADKLKSVEVDLISVIHVGDQSYYDELNRVFRRYDAVLYELVAPEGTRVPKGGAPPRHPVSHLQHMIKDVLDLTFQLDHIDYTKPNLVHADMDSEQLARSMRERGESFVQILFRMIGQAAAQGARDGAPTDAQLLVALLSPDRSLRLKRILAEQFEDLETTMALFEGPNGSTLISQRNQWALRVLRRQIDQGNKRLAIFYGAGHMPDMARRLQEDFHFRPVDQQWLVAWNLRDEKEGQASGDAGK